MGFGAAAHHEAGLQAPDLLASFGGALGLGAVHGLGPPRLAGSSSPPTIYQAASGSARRGFSRWGEVFGDDTDRVGSIVFNN